MLIELTEMHPDEYRRLWRYVLWDRHGRACAVCREPLALDAVNVDHIVSRADGGTDAWENLQPTHRGCNVKRGHIDTKARRARLREVG